MKNYIGSSIAANLFRGKEAVGGKIFFEGDGLVFKSHAINIQRGELQIEYSQIESIKPVNSLGIIPNGIIISTTDQQEYKFVINNRKEVIEFLMSKKDII